MDGEKLLLAMLIWVLASLPAGVLLGTFIARANDEGEPRPRPGVRPRHGNANVIKFPRRKRQYHGARLPEPPEPPEAA